MLRCRCWLVASLLVGASVFGSGCLEPDGETASRSLITKIEPQGESGALDVATWNLSWFGSTAFGPTDEALQLENVAAVISALELDLWALEEVVSAAHFADLVDELDGYVGLLASDPGVEGGDSYHSGEQKVGVVLRKSLGSILEARVILRDHDFDFAGRPPLEVEIELDGGERLFVIVFHAKAGTGEDDWFRRRGGAIALGDYLAGERAGEAVLVIGDYNDDLDESIRRSRPSPYQDLVDDHLFATLDIAEADIPTTVSGEFPLDHALVAGSLADAYRPGSAAVFPADDFVVDYQDTTSDHFPVHFKLDLELAEETPSEVMINEILANEPGGDIAGEFVELYNPGAASVSLEGWTLSDEIGVRHRFESGTSIGGGEALVVSGGAVFDPGETVVASEGGLGLNNSGDTLTLATADGSTVAAVGYGSSLGREDGVSMTREIDGDDRAPMISHLEVSSIPASPGAGVDGAPL